MRKVPWGIGGLLAVASFAAGAADSAFWVGGGWAGALGDNNYGPGWYGRLFTAQGRGVIGLTHTHFRFDDTTYPTSAATNSPNQADLKETSLLVGAITLNHALYFAFGPSRVQIDGSRCQREQQTNRCIGTGIAAEFAVELPWVVGLEFRLFGNANPADKFSGISVGLRFGSEDGAFAAARVEPRDEEVIPAPAETPTEIRPAPPAPAPGKSARIRSDAKARVRPQLGADGSIPAGTSVTIKSSISNHEGTWWYVEGAGKSGWARAEDLEVAQ